MKKAIFIMLALMLIAGGFAGAKERSIVALSGHELGDQTFSIGVGLFLPLFHQFLSGEVLDANTSPGAMGFLNWNAYLNHSWRLGLELCGAFAFDVNSRPVVFLPVSAKISYVMNIDRFEIPVFLNLGVNIGKYGEEHSNIMLFLKPGVACFYRWDSNLSFGGRLAWWASLELPTSDTPTGMMGYHLEISPALFYHF
ncbi:MAG: hypothetical protein JXR70_14740 [Spirochaetales bacterium]|nr:hypothetical protein [Spirochaetales bacterium]